MFVFLFTSFSFKAQVQHAESFDANTFLPTGWAAVGQAPDWNRTTNLAPPLSGTPHTGTGMARLRYPNNGTGTINEAIATPSFDLTGRGSNAVEVSFWTYRDSLQSGGNDSLTVFVNTTSSLTGATKIGAVARNRSVNLPDTKATNGWYQYTFSIPAQFNTNANFLIFQGTLFGPSNTARRIYLDDVSWTEFPAPCSGTPSPGVLQSSTTFICGGSGSANLSMQNAPTDTGISFLWLTSANATGPYDTLSFTSTTALTGNITQTQYYICQVACSTSGLTANSDTLAVVVNNDPLPQVSIAVSSDTICRGESVTLTASGATSYVWSSNNNPNVSTQTTLTVNPFQTTTITLIGSTGSSCSSLPVTQIIVVGRTPNIMNFSNSNPTICSGGSSVLTVTANSGPGGPGGGNVPLSYNWSPAAANSNTITVSPTTTTLYTVMVTGEFGCSTSDTTTVSINPNLVSPVVTVSPTSFDICQGAGGQITATASSDISGTTFSWAAGFGPPINNTTNTLTTNVGNFSSVYTVTGTNPANGCTSSASVHVNVRPNPFLTMSTTTPTVCTGGSAAVTVGINNTGGANTADYTATWTPNNATGLSVMVNPTQTTTYYVSVVSPYGCSANDSITVSVNNALTSPTVTLAASETSFCGAAMPVQLVATTSAGQPTYSWTPLAISANNDTITVTPQATSVYSVQVADPNGCSSSASVTVVVSQNPTATFSYNQVGNGVYQFNVNGIPNATYMWDLGDGTTSTEQNPQHTYTTNGTFTVTLVITTSAGCIGTYSTSVVNQLSGIVEWENSLSIYPNPMQDNVQIRSDYGKKLAVELMDMSGKTLLTSTIQSGVTSLNLAAQARGVYFIRVSENGNARVYKLIKQ